MEHLQSNQITGHQEKEWTTKQVEIMVQKMLQLHQNQLVPLTNSSNKNQLSQSPDQMGINPQLWWQEKPKGIQP